MYFYIYLSIFFLFDLTLVSLSRRFSRTQLHERAVKAHAKEQRRLRRAAKSFRAELRTRADTVRTATWEDVRCIQTHTCTHMLVLVCVSRCLLTVLMLVYRVCLSLRADVGGVVSVARGGRAAPGMAAACV